MMFKSVFVLFAGSLLLGSCTGTKTATSSPKGAAKVSVTSCGQTGSLVWERYAGTKLPASAMLPESYTVYTVSGAAGFFKQTKTDAQEVMIPMPAGCITFKVVPSGTMSEGLQEKYPQLVSLRGSNGAGDDLRLDWDGTAFRGQVIAAGGGKTFFVAPYPKAKGATYLVYDKSDSREEKQPFEINRSAPAGPAEMQMRAVPAAEK